LFFFWQKFLVLRENLLGFQDDKGRSKGGLFGGGGRGGGSGGLRLGLELAVELGLLVFGLEATVTKLGRSVDEFELDLLEGISGSLGHDALSQGEDSLLDAGGRALDHEEVQLDDTVMGEATQGSDGLLGQIDGGGAAGLVAAPADAIDLLVDFGSVMVTVLTGAGDRPLNTRRMPRSNTSNLTKTLVSLAGQTSGSPTGGDTFVTLTLGDTDDVDHLVLLENGGDGDGLLEEADTEVDLIGDGSSVDLDLHEMSLLLSDAKLADLGVDQQADDRAATTDAFEFLVDGVSLLLRAVLLAVFGEGLLLGFGPVFVESSSDIFREMLGPDGCQRAKSLGSVDVSNNTNGNHRRSFQDGNGFNNFFLVELRSGLIHFTKNVSATSLVGHESGQMWRFGDIISGEALDLSLFSCASLSWEESQRTAARSLKFSV